MRFSHYVHRYDHESGLEERRWDRGYSQSTVEYREYRKNLLQAFKATLVSLIRLFILSQEPLFVARVVYDLLFFFIVIIIVLNLIFGVIIDTFADLRSEKQQKELILKNTCFICGKLYFHIYFSKRISFAVFKAIEHSA